MQFRRLAATLICLVATACGGGSNPPSEGGSVDNGSRIAWAQHAADAASLANLHFVMYVDGVRAELAGASCTSTAGSAGFPCSAPMPAMSAGQHTLELASYIVADPVVESPKSASIVVTVSGSATIAGSVASGGQAPPSSSSAATRDLTTADGARLRIELVTPADRPAAVAVSDDGAVLVAERAGLIRVLRGGAIAGESQLPGDGDATGILDLVVDPGFARNHLVYVLEAVAGAPPTFRLSRFRETGGRLGERAVLIDAVPASSPQPAGALAFGPDARLYVAFDDGGDPEGARRAASDNGKVLRLNTDGTTPDDQPGASPVYASNLTAPRSLVWDGSTPSLWVADAGSGQVSRLRASRRGLVATPYRLPLPGGPAALAIYRGALVPALVGNLLAVPVEDATYVLRARFSGADQATVALTETLDIPDAGFVRLVEVGPDGAVYVGTDIAVVRIAPR